MMVTNKKALLLLSLSLLFIAACSKPPAAEVAIAANIEAVQRALEEKNRSDVLAFISDDFNGNGYLNREELARMLLMQFLAHNKIMVTVLSSDIRLEPGHTDLARAELSVIVTGATRLIPDDGRIYRVTGRWALIEGEWLLEQLRWE